MSNEIDARAICEPLTNSGYTAFQISSWRPNSNILVSYSTKEFYPQLTLFWELPTFLYDKFESTDNTIEEVNSMPKKEGYIKEGDMLINLASMPISNKGMVNTMKYLNCKFIQLVNRKNPSFVYHGLKALYVSFLECN